MFVTPKSATTARLTDLYTSLLSIHDVTDCDGSMRNIFSVASTAIKSILLVQEVSISLLAEINSMDSEFFRCLAEEVVRDRSTIVRDSETGGFICSPIFIGDNLVAVVGASSKITSDCSLSFDQSDREYLETFASTIGIAIKRSNDFYRSHLEVKKTAGVLSILRANCADESLQGLWKVTIDAVIDMLNPQLCSIFVCDYASNEVFNVATKEGEGIEGLTLPFGQGFVGIVAESGIGVRTNDAYADPRFFRHIDRYTGQKTRNLLCLPVPGFLRNSRPIAVVQVINKLNGHPFHEAEEEALGCICTELSRCLQRKTLELNTLIHRTQKLQVFVGTALADPDSDAVESSILREYGASEGSGAPVVCLSPGVAYRSDFTLLIAESTSELSQEEMFQMITNHNTDPFALTEVVMIELAVQMISSYGLLTTYSIDVKQLRSFFSVVRSKYRPNNSFHNFKHAWGVMHMCFMLLRYGADALLLPLDILALLISAICHDVDHPGNNNAFEIARRSELAITYADDAVLERHHLAVTHGILSNPTIPIISGLNSQQQIEFRGILTSAILATDMSQHFKILDDILRRSATAVPYDRGDAAARKALVGHILHAADIGAQTQARSVALQWTDRLVAEFTFQANLEVQYGLPLTPFLHGLDDDLKRMHLQVGFLNGVVGPLWGALASFLPALEPVVAQLDDNKSYYVGEVERITSEKALTQTTVAVENSKAP